MKDNYNLQWREAFRRRYESNTMISYVFGPCIKMLYKAPSGEILFVRYFFRERHFRTEELLIKYVDEIAKKEDPNGHIRSRSRNSTI